MADDIDIEEHDLMANSLMKGMLHDLSVDLSIVKTELILDDDVEEEPAYEDHPSSTYTGIPDSTTDIFNGLAPRTAESPHIVSSTQEDFAKADPFNNRIILGTKRKVIVDDDVDLDHCYSATVILKDWGSYLNSSDSFCQECDILFATVNALDAHKMTAHSFLVAVEPAFSEAAEKPATTTLELKTRNCFVCKEVFSNETELIKHIYEHIELKTKTTLEPKETIVVPANLAYQCDVCLCYYQRTRLFVRHMHFKHKTKPSDFEKVSVNMNCAFCEKKYISIKSYNEHIVKNHRRIYLSARTVPQPKLVVKKTGVKLSANSKLPDKPGIAMVSQISEVRYIPKATLFKCFKCDVCMTSFAMSKKHHAACSRRLTNHRKCNKCNLMISKACISDHLIQHKFGDVFDIHDVGLQDLDSIILNKCPKCTIYFTENHFQMHLRNCRKTDSFKCTDCHLTIESAVQITHEMLHQTSVDDFIMIVYVPVDNPTTLGTIRNVPNVPAEDPTSLGPLRKVPTTNVKKYTLYICKHCTCALTQNEGFFIQKHVNGECKTLHKAICRYCGLCFTPHLLQQHYKMHLRQNDYNLNNIKFLQLDDLKLINPLPEYPKCDSCQVHMQFMATKRHRCYMDKHKTCPVCKLKFNLKTIKLHMAFHQIALESGTPKIDTKGKEAIKNYTKYSRKRKAYALYYCSRCKSCLHRPSHWEKKNIRCTDIRQETCNLCGLLFTRKSLIAHRAWHKRIGGSLHDIQMYNLDRQKIAPPLPTYIKCNKCTVFFYSKYNLKMHKSKHCKFQEFKTCDICNIKLCPETYALHMPFHEYSENSRAKTQGPAKLQALQVAAKTSGGDLTLYYCDKCNCCFQSRGNHVGKMKVFCGKSGKFVCDWCGLTFTRRAYDIHKQIHEKRNIVLKDFTIYRVRDRVQIAPPIYMGAYISCKKCSVVLHTKMARKTHNCDYGAETCSSCNIDFDPRTYAVHMAFHTYTTQTKEVVAPISQITFKIYRCAKCGCCYRDKWSISSHLKSECGDVMLKECPSCKLHVKDTKAHMALHASNPDFTRKNFEVINVNSAKDLEAGKKDVYQCSVCQYVAFTFTIMSKHKLKCRKKLILPSFCDICQFQFGKMQQQTHKRFHDKYPEATRKDLNVMPFHPADNINDNFLNDKKISIGTKKPLPAKKHQFYQCTVCRFICFNLTLKKHHKYTCKTFPQKQKVCNKCKLPIRTGQINMHLNMHALHPDMTPDNITVTPFTYPQHKSEPILTDSRNNDEPTVTPFRYPKHYNKQVLTDSRIDEEPLTEKLIFYKCRTCLNVLSGKKNNMYIYARRHVKNCKGFIAPMSTCEVCNLSFHRHHIKIHRRIHDVPPYDNPDNIKTIEFDKSDYMRLAPKVVGDSNEIDVSRDSDVISVYPGLNDSDLAEDEAFIDIENVDDTTAERIENVDDTTAERIENVDDTTVERKYLLFKCNICKSSMCWEPSKHRNTNCSRIPPHNFKKCPICFHKFNVTCIKKHVQKHILNPDMIPKNIKVIQFGDIKCISELYHCKQCEVHFLSEKKAIEHLEKDHSLCSDICTCHCGLSFLESDLETHRQAHHHGDKNESTDFKINDINVLSNKRPVDEGCRKRKYNGKLVESATLTKMYQCDCNLIFLCKASLKEHQATCSGESDVGVNCNKCELIFDSTQLLRHSLKHHNLESDVKYMIIKCTLEDERAKIENGKNLKLAGENDLFYCKRCHVCFVKQNTLEKHLNDHVTLKKIVQCKHCGIKFSKISLDRHLVLHHNNNDIDFFNIRDVLYTLLEVRPAKIEITENVDDIRETINEEFEAKITTQITENDTAEIIEKFTVGIEEHTTEEMIVEAAAEIREESTAEIIENSTAEVIKSTTTEITENVNAQIKEPTEQIKEKVSMTKKETLNYYKCRDCKVIFLNEESSHDHAVNHVPLTDFDYMECKVCKLNYVLDSLKQHMSQHKNNEFSLEKVQIKIVDPNSSLPHSNSIDLAGTERTTEVNNERKSDNLNDRPKKIILVYK